jgi:tRNA(fMet)-specific endonuclease VapC
MPRFMLGHRPCSCIMKRSHPLLLKRLQSVAVSDICMSVVTKAELHYGVAVSPRRDQDSAALAALLPYVEVLAFDEDAALNYAESRARGACVVSGSLRRRSRGRVRAYAAEASRHR